MSHSLNKNLTEVSSIRSSLGEILFAAIRDRAILRGENQRLVAPNGAPNTWLIDMRRVLLDATLLDAAADLFWDMCGDKMPFQVGGMEVAAIPLVTAILMKSVMRGTPVNGFIVHKERKTYGAGNLIEGRLTEAPVVVVDDIINSAESLEKVRVSLEQYQRTIGFAFVLIDYHQPKGEQWRQTHKIPVVAPFSVSDFGLTFGNSKNESPRQAFRNVWTFASPDPNFHQLVPKSFPATNGKYVYFGSDCGKFWCLDARTGDVAWNFTVHTTHHKNIWSAPALNDEKVYFGGYDGNVYCLDAATGKEIWRYTGAEWVGSSPAIAADLGLLFIGLEFSIEGKNGSIAALNFETGEKVWEHKTKRYTHASPAYWPERRLVACGSNDDEIFLFDARTGVTHWRFQTRGEGMKGSIRHAPAFDAKRESLVTGCADGYIYIIDVHSGKEIWSVRTNNTIYSVPLVVNDTAFIGSTDKFLYVLDLERRTVKRKISTFSKIFGPPRLLEGRVYFGACNGKIYELDSESGQVSGTHQLPDAITNAITYSADTGLFYALTYTNQIFAMERLP